MQKIPQQGGSAVTFTGHWREFLPIALTNLALTLATLGIYRFWAKARERRYLWSRSQLIDDSLEWTGTGREMFVGFLLVMALFLPVLLILNFGLQALALRGYFAAAAILAALLYLGIFYFIHVARFRALRYQLSRTYWHGIRGGSADPGWSYGWSGLWKMGVAMIAAGLLVPWAMVELWNQRWSRMSFGSHPFRAEVESRGLIGRWLIIYTTPVIAVALVPLIMFAGAAVGGGDEAAALGATVGGVVGLILVYLIFLVASLGFYALFYRRVAAATKMADLEFEFTARSKDWLKLILGNIGLVIVTFGVGLIFLGYRNWSFMIRHLEAYGQLDVDRLTQSSTRAPNDAEGLAETFDIGAV